MALRAHDPHRLVVKGLGPLVAGIAFVIAMILLVPSVAPEHIVQRPAGSGGTEVVDE